LVCRRNITRYHIRRSTVQASLIPHHRAAARAERSRTRANRAQPPPDVRVTERQSALIDLGGGDTTLRSLAAEMPGLAAHIEAAGMAPVMFHLTGPQPEDLLPALTLAARGFTPTAQALVFNEYAINPGSTRERAFGRLTASSGYGDLAGACVKLWMPRLHAAEAVESRQCSFAAARDGAINAPLGLFDAARVRVWLDAMDCRFAGVRSWIP
jgi:hypothetical protein